MFEIQNCYIDRNKIESFIIEIENIKKQSILSVELNSLLSHIEQLFIIEADKYITSIQIIKEYYMKTNNNDNSISLTLVDSKEILSTSEEAITISFEESVVLQAGKRKFAKLVK